LAAAEGALAAYQNEGQSFSPSERAELVRLHAKITDQAKDIAFLDSASAYFAGKYLM
jgi:transposase